MYILYHKALCSGDPEVPEGIAKICGNDTKRRICAEVILFCVWGNHNITICFPLRQDELCIVKYNEDGLWYRGRCLEVVGDGYPTILFIDYGNVSIVHIDDIRRYPTQFTYPIYTADCEIEG